MEIRFKSLDVECRDDGSYKIGGYVNVTERESELLYSGKRGKWFNEVVKQGAFTRSLNSGKEIPLLLEHDYNRVLDNTSGSLTLTEDQIGLRFDAEIRDKEVYEKVKNKQINNCSFGFVPVDQEYEAISDVREKRFLKDLELLEISLVENPAYAGSLVEVRNLNKKEEEIRKSKEEKLEETEQEENESKQEVETEEVENTEEVETEEKVEDENSEEEDSSEEKDDEKRGFVEEQIQIVADNAAKEEAAKEIINELIDEKEQQLKEAEYVEQLAKEELECVKSINKSQENYLESDLAMRSLNILKLRVQLLKLKSI